MRTLYRQPICSGSRLLWAALLMLPLISFLDPAVSLGSNSRVPLATNTAISSSAGDTTVSVQLANYSFAPNLLAVPVDTTITWTNTDNDTHNVAIAEGPELFVSPVLNPHETVSHLLSKP